MQKALFSLFAVISLVPLLHATITLNISQPTANQTVNNSVTIKVSVTSTFEITNVIASVSGQQTKLSVSGPNMFEGALSLAAIARGPKTLTVAAADAFGESGSAQVNVLLDRPPQIQVLEPESEQVVRRFLPIRARCLDDNPNCVLVLQVYPENFGNSPIYSQRGTNSIMATVDVSAYDHAKVIVSVMATDSAGQNSSTSTVALIEANPRLIEESKVPGRLWDFDATQLLFSSGAPGPIKIRNRATGLDTEIGYESRSLIPHDFSNDSGGFLTSHGAIFITGAGVQEWRDGELLTLASRQDATAEILQLLVKGRYAAWRGSSAHDIAVRDLETGTQIANIPAADSLEDLAASGAVAYTRSSSNFVSFWPAPLGLYAGGRISTDGTNAVFLASSNSPGNVTFKWLMLFDGSQLTQLTPPSANADLSARVNQGWLAFTKIGPGGVAQAWRRPPGGTATQLTFFGANSYVRWLGPQGDLIYSREGDDYMVFADGSTVSLGSNGFRQYPDFYFSDHVLRRIVGRSLFTLSTIPRFARLVETSQSGSGFRFTIVGDTGLTSVVQRASSLNGWQNLSTNVLSRSGIQLTNQTGQEAARFYRVLMP